jgi:hypothetical protein
VTPLYFWPGEAVQKSGAGTRVPEGPFIVAASTRVRFSASPPGPRAVPVRRLAAREAGQEEAGVDEVTDEPLYRDRVCGIDIGKAQMVATIRVPSDKDPSRRMAETRTFGTVKSQVLALADWLRCWQVPAVVMEATEVIRGARGRNRTLPRSCHRGRVRDEKDKSGNDER